jgi:ubiquitin carboxyl-terminal hydrolase 1
MFSDTIKGSVDMASASVKYLYDKAAVKLGGLPFDESELTEEEKRNGIDAMIKLNIGGLYNEGNTCFLNSVIQSLAACQHLAKFTDSVNGPFSTKLKALIEQINQKFEHSHTYSTSNLIRALGNEDRWHGYDQEDAQEFFQAVLLKLEKERESSVRAGSPIANGTVNGNTSDAEDRSRSGSLAPTEPITPFDGMFATRVGCLKCGEMEGIRKGVISSVDLSLQNVDDGVGLEQLLSDYCSMETIPGVECYRCSLVEYREELVRKAAETDNDKLQSLYQSRTEELSDALAEKTISEEKYKRLKPSKIKELGDKTKQSMFTQPVSDILMIHINRSVFDLHSGYSKKNYTPVAFPVCLDMGRYVVDAENKTNHDSKVPMHGLLDVSVWYKLKAAIIHYGSAHFGHYVCYRRCDKGFWWRVSDESVSLTSEANVLRSQGVFMLFYERSDSPLQTPAALETCTSFTRAGEGKSVDYTDESSSELVSDATELLNKQKL